LFAVGVGFVQGGHGGTGAKGQGGLALLGEGVLADMAGIGQDPSASLSTCRSTLAARSPA
jgi:hypothetical protein